MKRLLAMFVPILLVTVALFAQQLELPLVSPKPVPIHDPTPAISLSGLKLPPVSSRQMPDYGPGQATGLPNLSLPPVSSTSPPLTPGGGLLSISLPPTEPDVTEPTFEDFTGGWNTEDFPDNIDDKDALEIENFVWSKRGRLEPRPGYALYNDTEIESGEHIWGLYRHYKRDRRSVLYVGLPDSLYVDTSQAQSGSFLSTGYGWTDNEEFFDFETFKDYCIVAHKGDTTRILDELDVTSLTFGFADSIEQIVCSTLPFSGCTAFVCCDNVDWIPNQWAGYWLSKTMTPYDDNDYYTGLPKMIIGNSESVLYMPMFGSGPDVGLGYGWKYIFGLFDYDSVDAVVVDTSAPGGGCGTHVVIDDWSTADTIWDGGLHVIRMITGDAAGLEADIVILGTSVFPTDSVIFVNDFFGNSGDISAGDTALILRNSFWKAELVKAHKNRLFMVVRNNWPESGQFIVFSEYNSVTHFDKDNYIPVRTDDGDKITQLATFYQDQLGYKDNARDGLVIFKENSIFTLTFIDETNYYLTQVVPNVGCMAGQTVRVIENKYMLFLHSSGVYAFDGRTVTLLTKKIHSVIEEIERHPDHDRSVAGYDDRHYYLSSPGLQDTTAIAWGFVCGFPMDSASGTLNGGFLHKFDADGNPTGNDLFCRTTTTLGYTDVATDTLGRTVFIWPAISEDSDLYLSRFNSDHERVGDSLKIPDGIRIANVKTDHATVDMDNAGNIIVCWIDKNSYDDVWCQYVDWTDGKVDTNFVVNSDWSTNTLDCDDAHVSMNNDGIAVVVWQDARNYTPDHSDIYGQIYQVPDSAIGNNFLVKGGSAGWDEDHPAVAVTIDRFVVSYQRSSGGTELIQKRVFDIDGTAQEAAVTVANDDCYESAVSINAWGNHVVTWDSAAGWDVYGQRYGSDNASVGDRFKVYISALDQQYPAVALNNANIFTIVWKEESAGAAPDIYYRTYDWADTLTDALVVNTSDADESCGQPEIDIPDVPISSEIYSLAWNIDYGGWSKIVGANAGLYAEQKGLADTINLIFSDPAGRSYVYEFGKVFQDTGQDISVLFKSKAFDFNSISNQKRVTRFFLNYYLDEGDFDLTFYTDFGDTSQYTSTVSTSGGYRYVRVPLDWTCRGRNFSYKIESTDDLRIDKIRLRLKVEED